MSGEPRESINGMGNCISTSKPHLDQDARKGGGFGLILHHYFFQLHLASLSTHVSFEEGAPFLSVSSVYKSSKPLHVVYKYKSICYGGTAFQPHKCPTFTHHLHHRFHPHLINASYVASLPMCHLGRGTIEYFFNNANSTTARPWARHGNPS